MGLELYQYFRFFSLCVHFLSKFPLQYFFNQFFCCVENGIVLSQSGNGFFPLPLPFFYSTCIIQWINMDKRTFQVFILSRFFSSIFLSIYMGLCILWRILYCSALNNSYNFQEGIIYFPLLLYMFFLRNLLLLKCKYNHDHRTAGTC